MQPNDGSLGGFWDGLSPALKPLQTCIRLYKRMQV